MINFIILMELVLLVVFYVLITKASRNLYRKYKKYQNKPEILSMDDDINITHK